MTQNNSTDRINISEVIEKYGKCLELIPTDPHFHGISVGLYFKGNVGTVWTFSKREDASNRIEVIRDQLVRLGGLSPVEGSHNQISFPCGVVHVRPIKFLLAQAVGKSPDYASPIKDLSIRDTKTKLTLSVAGSKADTGWTYEVFGEGDAPGIPARLRLIIAGFLRYGEMKKINGDQITFECGWRHDEIMRLLLPYSRNISAVENMMDEESLRGQMTTSTLGFTPT